MELEWPYCSLIGQERVRLKMYLTVLQYFHAKTSCHLLRKSYAKKYLENAQSDETQKRTSDKIF